MTRQKKVHPSEGPTMPRANPEKLEVKKELPRPDIVFALARAPGTSSLYCGGSDFSVCEIDLSEAQPKARELGRHDSYVTSLTLAGKTLVSGGYDGRLLWWDIESRSIVRQSGAHSKWVRCVAATPDGSVVASVADDMVCRLWDVATGKLIRELRGHAELTPTHFPSMLFACAISPDGRQVATGDKVGHITVWDLETGRSLTTLETPELYTWDPVQRRHSIGGIRSLAFSPDGSRLAAGGSGKISNIDHLDGKATVAVFDWQSGTRTHEFASDKFKGLVEYLGFHPQGDWLLAAGGTDKDGFLSFFDLTAKKVLAQEQVPMYIHDVALSEDGDTIYAAGHHKIAVLGMQS
jgi:WD40 repeat protein